MEFIDEKEKEFCFFNKNLGGEILEIDHKNVIYIEFSRKKWKENLWNMRSLFFAVS